MISAVYTIEEMTTYSNKEFAAQETLKWFGCIESPARVHEETKVGTIDETLDSVLIDGRSPISEARKIPKKKSECE